MINWALFQPRNLAIVVLFIVIAYFIYNHFTKNKGQ